MHTQSDPVVTVLRRLKPSPVSHSNLEACRPDNPLDRLFGADTAPKAEDAALRNFRIQRALHDRRQARLQDLRDVLREETRRGGR